LNSILCIETATNVCSVCVARDGELLALRETTKGMSHTSLASVFVKEVLEESEMQMQDLSAVAVSGGPGSYTGLRVGVSLAKGICSGAHLPLIAINTLESLASASIDRHTKEKNAIHIAMIDARRMEVYMAAYGTDRSCIQGNKPFIIDKEAFQEWANTYRKIYLSGDGTDKTRDFLNNPALIDSGIRCSASNLVKPAFMRLKEADYDDLAYYSPNYIKSPNITQPRKALF